MVKGIKVAPVLTTSLTLIFSISLVACSSGKTSRTLTAGSSITPKGFDGRSGDVSSQSAGDEKIDTDDINSIQDRNDRGGNSNDDDDRDDDNDNDSDNGSSNNGSNNDDDNDNDNSGNGSDDDDDNNNSGNGSDDDDDNNNSGDNNSGGSDDDDNTPPGSTADEGPGGFQGDFRTSGDFFTQTSGMVQGVDAHGMIQIWYSINIKETIKEAQFIVPKGTTAIKEFDNNGEKGYAVMVKREDGYDAAANNWYYEFRDLNGNILTDPAPGRNTTCISCHSSARAKDFLAGTEVKDDNKGSGNGGNTGDPGDDDNDNGWTPGGNDLADYGPGMFRPDFKFSGDFYTNTDDWYEGSSPHGNVKIWYSKNIEHLASSSTFLAPVGTTAIKEFDQDKDGIADGVAVMIKRDRGYDPSCNDWYYEMRDPFGALKQTPKAGRISTCAQCHSGAQATDFLAGTKIGTGSTSSGDQGPGAFKANYYWSSEFFTQMARPADGNSPHDNVHVWYSSNIKDLIKQPQFTVPVGTVAVKRFKQFGSSNIGLAVMIKQEAGYDPANNDWRYEMRDQYGNLKSDPAPGKIGMCISCHSQDRNTDFLSGTALKN